MLRHACRVSDLLTHDPSVLFAWLREEQSKHQALPEAMVKRTESYGRSSQCLG